MQLETRPQSPSISMSAAVVLGLIGALSIATVGSSATNATTDRAIGVTQTLTPTPTPKALSDHVYLQRMQRLQEQQHKHLCARCLCYGLRKGKGSTGQRVVLDEELNEITSPRPTQTPSTAKPATNITTLAPVPVRLQVLVINCTARLPAQDLVSWSFPARLSLGEAVADDTWAEFQGGNLSGVSRLARLPFRLTNLSLADNALHVIAHRAFANLGQLRHLDLRHNHLKDVPFDAFGGLSSLEWLDLSFNSLGSNRLPALPLDLFSGMDRLSWLNLRHNALSGDLNGNTLPKSTSLRILDLSHNKFTSLSAGAWVRVPNLKELDLSWNELRSVTPHAFQEVSALERLDLSHNPALQVLPEGLLAGLGGLRALDLSHCPLGRQQRAGLGVEAGLEAGAERAVQLAAGVQELRLSFCSLDEFLLRGWGGLHELHVLDLSGNDISVLSDIAHLDLLRELNLSHNGLTRFPTVTLPVLETLDLSHNQLERPPAFSAALTPRLRNLRLDGNPMEELHLGVPPSLRSLSARGMPRLTRLPQQAVFIASEATGANRTNVTTCLSVRISGNPALNQVHEKAFDLLQLCKLDLSHNALAWVSPSLTQWERLDSVDLQGNPWVCDCKLQWMLDSLVKRVYASQPALLEDVRCAAPKHLQTRRLVHWYNHTGSALCDSNVSERIVKGAGVTFSFSTPALAVVISAAAVALLLVVLGIIAHRRLMRSRRARNRRL